MNRYSVLPLVLVLFCFAPNGFAQHPLHLDDGAGNYSLITAPNPGGTYTLPAGGGTLLTSASFGSLLWLTGGNLGSSPNNQLGTLDATDLQLITGGLANVRMTISGTSGFIGIGTPTPNHLLEINGTVDATETDLFSSSNWDLAVNGDIAATGIIKSGAGVTIDGVSIPHEVGADQPLHVYTNNGDLTLSTGIPLGGDINLNPENIVNVQAQNLSSETKIHMMMNPNFGGVSWDYGVANSGQLGYIESGFDNFGFYINSDNGPANGGSFTVNFGSDHNGAPLQGFSVDGNGNGAFAGQLTLGNIPTGSSSLNLLTTNAGAVEQRTAASIIGATSWVLSGNTLSGATPQTPNEWLGSSNDYDVVFKSNNLEFMRLTDNGHLTNAPGSNPLDGFGQGSASNNLLWEVAGDGYAATISNTDNNPHRNGLLVSIAESTGAARLIDAQSNGNTKFLVSSDGATSIFGPAILSGANAPLNVNGSDGNSGNILESNGAGNTPSWVDASGVFIQNQFAGPQTADFWVSGNGTIAGGAIIGSGLNIAGGNLLMGGTTVLNQSRDLSNIGNISLAGSIGTATTINASGLITTAGGLNLTGVNAPVQVGGSAGASGQVFTSNGAGATPSWTTLSTVAVTSITGTANQVLANGTSGSAQTGSVTLTTPQDIATTSNVTFNSATLSSMNASQPVRTNASKQLVSGAINLAGGATEVSGTLPFANGGTGSTSYTASTALIVNPGNTAIISLANGGANTVLHGTTPPTYSAIGVGDITAGAANTFLTTNGGGTVAWTGLNVGTGLSGNGITTALANTGVLTVTGTANRITSSGGQNPSIDIDANYVGQSSITTLGTITTGVWNGTTVDVPHGGTGQTTFTTNGVLYGNAGGAINVTAQGAAGTVLHGNGGAPTFSAVGVTDLAPGANNTFLTTDGGGAVAWTGLSVGTGLSGDGISTTLANTGVLSVTGTANRISSSGGQNPSIDIDANYAGQSSITTLGTITTGVWNGSTVDIAHGGTGQATPNAAFDALSPMATFGDIIYEDATPTAAALAGNTTTTKMFLSQTGTGVISGVPAWSALSPTDVSSGGWALGGNTAPTSNVLGTLDGTDLNIVTGSGGPNTRIFISGATGNIGIGSSSTSNAAISFGLLTGAPAIHYNDGGASARYGVGVSTADAEMQNFIPGGSHFSWNLGGDQQTSGTNELMRLSGSDGTLSNTSGISTNNPLDGSGAGVGSSGINWQSVGGGVGYAATFSNIDNASDGADGLLVKTANTGAGALIFTAASGVINTAGTDWFRIYGNGNVQVTNLTASMPVKTDGSSNLVSGAIDLTTTDVTGVLPVANGGTNSSTALTNGAIMVSSGGAIVEGTSASDPSFTSVTTSEAKGAAAGHYAEQHTVAAGEIAGATVTIANAIVAGATSVVVANIVSSANGATSLLTSANAGSVVLTFQGGAPAANDVVNYIVVNP